jgi:hypothetical protein
MNNRAVRYGLFLTFFALLASCERHARADEVLIDLPSGFTGEVRIGMGVRGAPALRLEGRSYIVTLPSDGHFETSTILVDVRPRFRDADSGRIWGYAPAVWKTGDGIPIGGNIEFFVGTRQQYETQEARKHKSQFPEYEAGRSGG